MPSKSPAQARLQLLSLEYVAGLFDGEGYVNVSEAKRGKGRGNGAIFMFCAGITNTYLPVLDELMGFGGTIHRKSRKPNWNQAFEWRVTGTKAYEFLKQIHPFLRIKRDVVGQALVYREKWGSRPARKKYGADELTERRGDREKVVMLVRRKANANS